MYGQLSTRYLSTNRPINTGIFPRDKTRPIRMMPRAKADPFV